MMAMQIRTCNIKYHVSEEIWVLIDGSISYFDLYELQWNVQIKPPPPPKKNQLMSLYK